MERRHQDVLPVEIMCGDERAWAHSVQEPGL
jgi:hypothetical protein